MNYEIVRGRLIHVGRMARAMRDDAAATIGAFGFDPKRALRDAVIGSHYCRAAVVDGRPVAMWGLRGALLSDHAMVWLVLSKDVTGMPRAIITEARREMAAFGEQYDELATTVLPEDDAAIRFASFLGFHDRHDEEHDEMTRKERAEDMRHNPRHRIPVRDGYVIALGWHGAA